MASAVIQQRWLLEEIEKLWEINPERVAQLLSRALEAEPDLKWAVVIGAYLHGHINLGKAAELLNTDRWSLQEEFRQRGIPIRIGAASLEELQAEVEAAQIWARESQE
jgi:predicted HTH domain antitoxin